MTSKTISTSIPGYSFAAGGTNLTITATGKITGSSGAGSAAIYGDSSETGETVLNLGTVGGANPLYGIVLQDGATITNGSATDKVASIVADTVGIQITGKAGTITNFGSIQAGQKGIVLEAGGAVTNGSAADTTALISVPGYSAVGIDGGVGRVTNFGTIQGEVNVYAGGSITNQASGKITALNAIYLVGGASTLTNLGTVSGHVHVGSGQVVNGSTTNHAAFIGGGTYGVYLGTGTLTNFGTISGTDHAVAMQSGTVMIAEAGSKLLGGASYGQGATLVFGAAGGAGTISGLGTGSITGSTTDKFRDLTTYQVQAGASWTLSGTNNTLADGASLTILGTLSLTGTLAGAGTLAITGGTTAFNAGAQLTIAKVTQSGGAANILASLADAKVWSQSAGTLAVAASRTFSLSGAGDSFAGTVTGGGTLAITGGTTAFNTGAQLTIAKVAQSGGSANFFTSLTDAKVWSQSAGTLAVATGHTLTLSGAGDSFAGTLAGAGTLAITGGTDQLTGTTIAAATHVTIHGAGVTLLGSIANSGAITAATTSLTIAAAGATLSGGGHLTLTNAATNKVVGATAAATLTNVNNLISGGGQLGGGQMKLVNQGAGKITGNTAAALVIDTGTAAVVNAGTITAAAAGGVTIKSAVANSGTLAVTAGTLTVNGAVTGAGKATIAGGTADFLSTFSQNVAFTGTTGVLELAKSQTYAATISGFSLTGGTSLDLADIAFTSGKTKATFVENGAKTSAVLTVTDGTHTSHITLAGNFSASTFTVSSDGHGGTKVVDPTGASAPHFVAAMAAMGAAAGGSTPPAHERTPPAAMMLAHARD
jgi:hypothetical protein